MARGNAIGKAAVVLSTNADGLATGLKQAQTKIKSWGDQVGNGLRESFGLGGGVGGLVASRGGLFALTAIAGRELTKAAFDVRGFREELERSDKFAAKLSADMDRVFEADRDRIRNLAPELRAPETQKALAEQKRVLAANLENVQAARRELDRWTGKGDSGQRLKDLPTALRNFFTGTLGELQQDKAGKLNAAQELYNNALDRERKLKQDLAEFESARGKAVASVFEKIDAAAVDVKREADQLGMTANQVTLDNFRRELADIGVSGKDAAQKLAELDNNLKNLELKKSLAAASDGLANLESDLQEQLGRSHLSPEEKRLQEIERSGFGLNTGNVRGLLAMQADLERMRSEVADKAKKAEPVNFAGAIDAGSAQAVEIEARHRFRPDETHNPNRDVEKKIDATNRILDRLERAISRVSQGLGVL
jgi:hypothetical protein